MKQEQDYAYMYKAAFQNMKQLFEIRNMLATSNWNVENKIEKKFSRKEQKYIEIENKNLQKN